MGKKYSKQLSFGYDSNGKRIRKRFYADTLADLEEQIFQYKLEMRRTTNPSDITFEKYSEHWFETYKSHLATQTKSTYRTHLKHCSSLNPYEIRKITKSMCQRVVNESWEHPHAAKGVADVLKQIFQTAVSDGIITTNPAGQLSRPKLPKSKFHLLTQEELDAIDRADLNEQDRFFVTIMRVFGPRPGEVLALQPRDFDFRNGVLHITKNLELPSDNTSKLKATKTEATRDIPIPAAMESYFRKRVAAAEGFLLFPKANGGLYTRMAYRRLAERIWKAVNIELGGNKYLNLTEGFRLYDMRHRRATDLYYMSQRGIISCKQAAALMGHSEEVFIRTYSHIDSSKEGLDHIYDDLAVTNL